MPDYGSEVRAPQGTPPGDLVDGGCHSLAAETRTEFDSCQRSVSEPNGAVPGTQPSDDISMTGHGGQERCGAIRVAESVKSKASSRKSEEIERLSASLRQLEAEASETRRQLEEARAMSEAASARSVATRSSRAIRESAMGAQRSEPGVIPVSLSSSAISGLTPLGLAQVCAEPRGPQVFAMDNESDEGSRRSNGDDLREAYEFRASEPRQAEQRVEESMYTAESMREEAGAQVRARGSAGDSDSVGLVWRARPHHQERQGEEPVVLPVTAPETAGAAIAAAVRERIPRRREVNRHELPEATAEGAQVDAQMRADYGVSSGTPGDEAIRNLVDARVHSALQSRLGAMEAELARRAAEADLELASRVAAQEEQERLFWVRAKEAAHKQEQENALNHRGLEQAKKKLDRENELVRMQRGVASMLQAPVGVATRVRGEMSQVTVGRGIGTPSKLIAGLCGHAAGNDGAKVEGAGHCAHQCADEKHARTSGSREIPQKGGVDPPPGLGNGSGGGGDGGRGGHTQKSYHRDGPYQGSDPPGGGGSDDEDDDGDDFGYGKPDPSRYPTPFPSSDGGGSSRGGFPRAPGGGGGGGGPAGGGGGDGPNGPATGGADRASAAKVKEADKIQIPPYPESINDFRSWRRAVCRAVCAASGRGNELSEWIASVFAEGRSPSDFATTASAYASIDAKLGESLAKIVKGDLATRLGTMTDEMLDKEGRLPGGPSSVWRWKSSYQTSDSTHRMLRATSWR